MSGGGAIGGSQSLSFRVMRLCKPSFHVDTSSLRFHPFDILAGEDLFDDPLLADAFPPLMHQQRNLSSYSDPSYRDRFIFSRPFDPAGLSGLLVLPQSFGSIYLGETFCSYISINNSSNFEVIDVIVKAEMQTERQRVLLLDASKSPVRSIRAGGRYDFIVEHDIKELGAHTLVCTALYNDGDGERKYLPQFFKFAVSNPLSVKTKVRVVKDNTFMEACIENHTKGTLYMDQVEFEPSQQWSAVELRADIHDSEKGTPSSLRSRFMQLCAGFSGCVVPTAHYIPPNVYRVWYCRTLFKKPILLTSGGVRNFLYRLTLSSNVSTQIENVGNNVLGKLQITWRLNLGESGRLQTQQILTNQPVSVKELDLKVIDLPSPIVIARPFLVRMKLRNQTEKMMGPFRFHLLQDDQHHDHALLLHGLHSLDAEEMQGFGSTYISLNLVAVKVGIQKIPGVTFIDTRGGKLHDLIPGVEVFVDSR